jgi:hypothetical protein
MKLLDSLHFRIATLFHRARMNAEMEEELRSHVQHRADDLERSGLPRPEAERRARIDLHNAAFHSLVRQRRDTPFRESVLIPV